MSMRTLAIVPVVLLVAACSAAAPSTPAAWSNPSAGPSATVVDAHVVDVYKSPGCTCCHEWEAYLRARGFTVRSFPTEDMAAIKAQFGIAPSAASCHTAVIDGYAVEGHVPVEAIEDLLARRPAIDAIALPGMPPGSPGMPGEKASPFEILAIDDGTASAFGSY
jgi:hypothetical protein